jgi:hypothetical protein
MRTRPFPVSPPTAPRDPDAPFDNGRVAPDRLTRLGDDPGRPRRRLPGPSARPAALVFGITLLIFVGGLVALGLSPRTVPSSATATVRTAPGAPLRAEASTRLLAPIEVDGQPPANVLQAFDVPVGSRAVPGSAVNHSVANYDRQMRLTVDAPEAKVVDFFRDQLRADGWQQVSVSQAVRSNGTEVLGEHGGTDGNTWELGVVVSPTTFSSGSSAPLSGVTAYEVVFYIQNLGG